MRMGAHFKAHPEFAAHVHLGAIRVTRATA
jgi:hypothetical protein